MYMKDAIAEYGFDCRIRKLSPKTIDCKLSLIVDQRVEKTADFLRRDRSEGGGGRRSGRVSWLNRRKNEA